MSGPGWRSGAGGPGGGGRGGAAVGGGPVVRAARAGRVGRESRAGRRGGTARGCRGSRAGRAGSCRCSLNLGAPRRAGTTRGRAGLGGSDGEGDLEGSQAAAAQAAGASGVSLDECRSERPGTGRRRERRAAGTWSSRVTSSGAGGAGWTPERTLGRRPEGGQRVFPPLQPSGTPYRSGRTENPEGVTLPFLRYRSVGLERDPEPVQGELAVEAQPDGRQDDQ